LPERVFEPLNVIGFPRFLGDRCVLIRWNDAFIDLRLIRIELVCSQYTSGILAHSALALSRLRSPT
jgi:hypothetical protein